MLLQSNIDLTEVHGSWIGIQTFPECKMIAVFHGTDFLSFEILNRCNFLVCTHYTKSLIGHSQQMIAACCIDIADQAVKFRVINRLAAVLQ